MKKDVAMLLRKAIDLWPEVTLSRTCPYSIKTNTFGRFSWDAMVTDYTPEQPERLSFRARTLPLVLMKVIEEGKKRR